jgi:hypothetical protein
MKRVILTEMAFSAKNEWSKKVTSPIPGPFALQRVFVQILAENAR